MRRPSLLTILRLSAVTFLVIVAGVAIWTVRHDRASQVASLSGSDASDWGGANSSVPDFIKKKEGFCCITFGKECSQQKMTYENCQKSNTRGIFDATSRDACNAACKAADNVKKSSSSSKGTPIFYCNTRTDKQGETVTGSKIATSEDCKKNCIFIATAGDADDIASAMEPCTEQGTHSSGGQKSSGKGMGACCEPKLGSNSTGSCSKRSKSECESSGDVYMSDGSNCQEFLKTFNCGKEGASSSGGAKKVSCCVPTKDGTGQGSCQTAEAGVCKFLEGKVIAGGSAACTRAAENNCSGGSSSSKPSKENGYCCLPADRGTKGTCDNTYSKEELCTNDGGIFIAHKSGNTDTEDKQACEKKAQTNCGGKKKVVLDYFCNHVAGLDLCKGDMTVNYLKSNFDNGLLMRRSEGESSCEDACLRVQSWGWCCLPPGGSKCSLMDATACANKKDKNGTEGVSFGGVLDEGTCTDACPTWFQE